MFVVGKIAVIGGSGWLSVVSALNAEFIVSLAPLIKVRLMSNPRICRKALPFVNGLAEAGPLQLRFSTVARVPVPIASCRDETPVWNRLLPDTETAIGKTVAPFNDPVLSATRPPHPVCPVVFTIELIC